MGVLLEGLELGFAVGDCGEFLGQVGEDVVGLGFVFLDFAEVV